MSTARDAAPALPAPARASVRRATRLDCAAVARLWSDLVAQHAELDPPSSPKRQALGPALESALAQQLSQPSDGLWVADGPEGLAGFCAARLEPAPAALRERCRVVITELYVAPAARRRGLGRSLVAAALDFAREHGAPRVEVRVAAANDAGREFWQALGFATRALLLHLAVPDPVLDI